MRTLRMIDRSIYHYINTQLGATWTALDIKDGFPNKLDNLDLPTVSIDYITFYSEPLELGTESTDDYGEWHFNVFARDNGERDDISYDIHELLNVGCGIYNFSGGSPGDRIGNIVFRRVTSRPVFVSSVDVPRGVRYRSVVMANADITITG